MIIIDKYFLINLVLRSFIETDRQFFLEEVKNNFKIKVTNFQYKKSVDKVVAVVELDKDHNFLLICDLNSIHISSNCLTQEMKQELKNNYFEMLNNSLTN